MEAEKSNIEQRCEDVVKSAIEKEDEYISIVDRLAEIFLLNTVTMRCLDFLKDLESNQVQKSMIKCESQQNYIQELEINFNEIRCELNRILSLNLLFLFNSQTINQEKYFDTRGYESEFFYKENLKKDVSVIEKLRKALMPRLTCCENEL